VIGQDTLDRVRQEANVVEIIGESVKLQKRGRSYVGLCPFHKEKTPSFHVNAERGFYHCFGCHESGDAIKFVQQTEGLSFLDAVRRLAERLGIEIVETASDLERKQQSEARRRQNELYEIGTAAASYFERMLREHPLADFAVDELNRRGLTPATPTDAIADALQAFRLGYAPFGWDGLSRHLKDAGFSLAAVEKVGLIAPRKSGSGYYDRFRHRLMFAVVDLQGRIIAFSGRALAEPPAERLRALGLEPSNSSEAPAKYVNSPESPVYKKREAVFGLYQARQAVRSTDGCVIVEGNFDVVSLHARGMKHVVAPLGTAFTLEQARAIKRFTPNVTLLFDPDTAGRRAALASRDVCRAAGLNVKVATLPEGADPDELVRTRGVEQLGRILGAAKPMLEYLIDLSLEEGFAQNDAATRARKVREVTELIASEDDPTVRALARQHADRLAARLGISDVRTFQALEASIRAALNRPLGPDAKQGEARVPPPYRARSRDRKEDLALEVIGALLDFPELFSEPESEQAASLLEGDAAAALAALRQAWSSGSTDPETVLAKLAGPIHPFARARWAAPRHERLVDAKAELVGNLKKLESLDWSREKSLVVEELERVERTGDFEQQTTLLQERARRARERMARLRGSGGPKEA
jgi:DNA primase